MTEALYIAISIPVFFLAIGVESLIARRMGRRVYRFNDALVDLSCGIAQQLTEVFAAVFLLGVYTLVWSRWRVLTLSTGVAWLVALAGVDFLYYWWHRLSHEVNFLWAAHVVHHQSEDYNLAVALRQSVTTSWTVLPFYLPLALLGVPPLIYAGSHAISLLYQFWIHTELLPKLGAAETVMNTPSHHRVHHATNDKYLDKNYAAILIVWDRMFGTLEIERDAPVYGLVKPVASFSPLWVQVHYWIELARRSWRTRKWLDKIQVWLRGPAWRAPDEAAYPHEELTPATQRKYDVRLPRRVRAYVIVQFLVVSNAVLAVLVVGERWPPLVRVVVVALALATVFAWGGLLESRAWGRSVESVRLVTVAAAALALAPRVYGIVGAAACLACLLWLWLGARPASTSPGTVAAQRR